MITTDTIATRGICVAATARAVFATVVARTAVPPTATAACPFNNPPQHRPSSTPCRTSPLASYRLPSSPCPCPARRLGRCMDQGEVHRERVPTPHAAGIGGEDLGEGYNELGRLGPSRDDRVESIDASVAEHAEVHPPDGAPR